MSISPVAMTIACPNAMIANTAVICDNACMLPTDSQLPCVMIAKAKDIRTTMLTVADSGCLRTIRRMTLPHEALGNFEAARPPSRMISSKASALIASRGTSATLRPFSIMTIRSAMR